MKKLTLAVAASLLVLTCAKAQEFSLVSASEEAITVNYQTTEMVMSPEMTVHTTIESEDYRDFSKSHKIVSMEVGSPSLPFFTESVMIPNQGKNKP